MNPDCLLVVCSYCDMNIIDNLLEVGLITNKKYQKIKNERIRDIMIKKILNKRSDKPVLIYTIKWGRIEDILGFLNEHIYLYKSIFYAYKIYRIDYKLHIIVNKLDSRWNFISSMGSYICENMESLSHRFLIHQIKNENI